MIVYDRLWKTMKEKGVSQYSLIKNYHINEAQLYRLRKNMVVKTITLDRLCEILECEIEDICQYVKDSEAKK
ncbi:MAG: XRE family transcriptional regulator [Eubacteriales Family XIII. Incertae Sedis bacterium]|jgi:predicted transcriptional regulator|nr:MAG: XRE family transcriptional regulator [Clostridiales Family XIII bacterium]